VNERADAYREKADAYRKARRAERRRIEEIKGVWRERTDGQVREVMNRYFPAGTPAGFLVALQHTSQPLIDEVGRLEKAVKEMHDGVHVLAEEAAQRWVDGFNECEQKVRSRAAEAGMTPEQIEAILPVRGTVDLKGG
jgi:ribonucleotide reductase alpha subunit